MRKFVITGRKTNMQYVISYHPNGFMCGFEMLGDFTKEQLDWALRNCPLTIDGIVDMQKKGLPVAELIEDLSFDTFWSKYQYKVKRERAAKVWEKMGNADKLKAILGIARYDKHLHTTGQAKAYPDNYLKDKRWEDEY